MLLVHIGHCLGDPRAVRAQHRVDLVLRDELLVEAGRCLPIRCVIVDHELNPTPEHSAFLIRMLLAKKVTFTNVAPLYGGLSGESRGCADADRLLRQACGRRPQAKAEAKADQPTIFDAEHSRDLSRPTAVEESNYRHRRLLRARRERPRGRRAAEQRDELAPLYLIELHSVPVSQGRLVGYPIGEDQSGGIGANLQLVVRWRDTRQQSSIAAVQPNAGRSN